MLVASSHALKYTQHYRPPDTKVTVRLGGSFLSYHYDVELTGQS